MSNYYNKLQKALDYIEQHIKDDITLEQLSAQCFYSPHHFHRLFQSVIGIPVTDYIRKRKLSVAAKDIIETDTKIIDIAIEYGFNSNETFSRAFKRIFDITPNAYRKLGSNAIPVDFWKVSFERNDLQRKYMRAVESLCDRLKRDKNVIAVIIMGSLSYDQVWEKSDIDISIVVNDNCKAQSQLCLLEDDIYVNGNLYTRSEFMKTMNKTIKATGIHSYYSLGTMVYCKDDALKEEFDQFCNLDGIGDKDKSYSLMQNTAAVLYTVYKAEKWLKVKSYVRYSYIWIVDALRHISAIEVILNNNIPSREVILQALKYKNPIIEKLYIELMDNRKNSINISTAIDTIYEYLREHRDTICKPLIDYFDNVTEIKSLSTIVQDFNKTISTTVICDICEWLCAEGILVKDISETYITKKSINIVYEPAYFKSDMDVELFL